jgi:acyl carrier protein
LQAAPAEFSAFVSIRRPVSGEAARDRAWETRLFLDGLTRVEDGTTGIGLDLCLGTEGSPEALTSALDTALVDAQGSLDRSMSSPAPQSSPRILIERQEVATRTQENPSPLFEDLAPETASTRAHTITRSEFEKSSPPERRVAMRRFVFAELASVLGLSDVQHEALEPGSRLDSLGLDSLMSLELFMGLGRSLELEITPDWFDSIPTLAEIAATLTDRYVTAGKGQK